MIEHVLRLLETGMTTLRDVAPIVAILFGFQYLVIRKPVPNLRKVLFGFVYVVLGLTLFLVGLEEALFPVGKTMATQLTDPDFVGVDLSSGEFGWTDFLWVYAFAAAIGFATTVAEPSLIAVSLKAEEISGGALKARGLRMAVAVGVALGVGLGAYRIVSGTPLPVYIMIGYVIVIIQTFFSSKMIIPLAYDSGGVTTSTVTVPVVAALGLGLASTIPGRNALLDGFGLIAFASLFPVMSVLGYAMIGEALSRRRTKRAEAAERAGKSGAEQPERRADAIAEAGSTPEMAQQRGRK